MMIMIIRDSEGPKQSSRIRSDVEMEIESDWSSSRCSCCPDFSTVQAHKFVLCLNGGRTERRDTKKTERKSRRQKAGKRIELLAAAAGSEISNVRNEHKCSSSQSHRRARRNWWACNSRMKLDAHVLQRI